MERDAMFDGPSGCDGVFHSISLATTLGINPQLSTACRAVALAKEGEKLGNPSDLQLLQKTFDRMK
jgi:hypothetical protein